MYCYCIIKHLFLFIVILTSDTEDASETDAAKLEEEYTEMKEMWVGVLTLRT